ncbi:MAG: YmdB family metallophosphoesterase [Treponema sp.]|nr:YmdB family metallophosphoesterase [Treponema sp.]
MKLVNAVMIGDVIGGPGLEVLEAQLPGLIKENNIDFVTVNGENAADGFGMTEANLKQILAAGADVVTSGNHVWEKRDFWPVLEGENRILRPANYPDGSPGKGWVSIEKAGLAWTVINLQGREFMNAIECPFRCFDAIHKNISNMAGRPLILVDFHAESSREKEALAYHIDGRASLIAGTHTHVQTADERILPLGSAYITDLGMTGISSSVIGMDYKICLERVRKQVMYRMEPAGKEQEKAVMEIQGVTVEIDSDTGKAVTIRRIKVTAG